MEFFASLIDIILHVDVHLTTLTAEYGVWMYLILFTIVFAETGLVVAPFLPGDSLLFAAGSICALGTINVWLLMSALIVAAIAGDALNYAIGKRVGLRLLESRLSRFVKRSYIDRTHEFYERHGGKTIILARFMPIIRTFAPFVAGIGKMSYPKFAVYNIVGAIAWVLSFTLLGYFFGHQPIVKKNFSLVILIIMVISILPGVIEVIRHRKGAVTSKRENS